MEPAGDAGCLSVDCDQLVVSGFCKARAWGIEGARDSASVPSSFTDCDFTGGQA